MTHFCSFGTITPVLLIIYGWFFFKSVDLEVKQRWCKGALLNSDSRTRVKCENIFCVSLWQITSHNGTHACHNDKHLKIIEDSEATMTQPAKNFHAKDSVFLAEMHLLRFYFDFYSLWSFISHIWKSESW